MVFAVLIAIDLNSLLIAPIDLEVSFLVAGYVLLMPPVVSLLIPWSARVHLAWVGVHAAIVGVISVVVPPEAHATGGPRVLLALMFVSSAVSVFGNLANLRARLIAFTQLEQIRVMNRKARRDDVRLRRLNALLTNLARTDELTGLGNRVALQLQLQRIRGRIDRHGEQFAVLMLDLDHFKAINDRLGHSAGDAVLRQVGRAIEAATRSSDAAFRYGGEEFVVVVEVHQPGDVAVVGERIRKAVADLGIGHPANAPYGTVTISMGGCLVDRSRLATTDDAWFQSADAALYQAKRTGRNRSVIAGSGPAYAHRLTVAALPN
jgi:diguanylate cyclase (GGDEF)-like protein